MHQSLDLSASIRAMGFFWFVRSTRRLIFISPLNWKHFVWEYFVFIFGIFCLRIFRVFRNVFLGNISCIWECFVWDFLFGYDSKYFCLDLTILSLSKFYRNSAALLVSWHLSHWNTVVPILNYRKNRLQGSDWLKIHFSAGGIQKSFQFWFECELIWPPHKMNFSLLHYDLFLY